MRIKKSALYILGIILLVVIPGVFMLQGGSGSSGNVVSTGDSDGEIQEVVLGMKNFNYHPNSVKVKVNKPVRISLDKSVYGCFRDFTMREFGIREYLKTPEDTVEFTPTEKGRYTFACSMGMGTGTLIVE
jgi:plastocyanin domain-containing protein